MTIGPKMLRLPAAHRWLPALLAVISLLNLKKDWPPILKKIPAYAIGSLAAFWMVERIAGFWA